MEEQMLYTIVGMLVIILDQAVKFWVDKTINYTKPVIELIPGVVSLVRVQNDGAAFSFLAGGGARIWFIVLTLAFTVLVIIALATNFISGKFGRWCMVLVTAGGLSNMIDRVLYGLVIDMFRIDLFDFAVFNVADIFITVFCIAFIIYILFGGEKEPEPDEDEFDEKDYEEDDRPQRQPKKKKKERKYYDEPEDYYEEAPKSAKKSKKKSSDAYYDEPVSEVKKTSRTSSKKRKDEDDYYSPDVEDFFESDRKKADRRARPITESSSATRRESSQVSSYDTDPFAEWERANAKVKDEINSSSVAQAMNSTVGTRPVAPRPRPTAPKSADTESKTSAPSKPSQPKPTPASKPKTNTSSDSFDLDDILSEFK